MVLPFFKDRVKENWTGTGTGTASLSGSAVTGFQLFSAALATGNTCYYCIEAVNASGVPTGDWEVGVGTYTTSGNTLSRDTVTASSNSGSAVAFTSGTKYVSLVVSGAWFSLRNILTGYIAGFELTYVDSTHINVGRDRAMYANGPFGVCRNSDDGVSIVLASQSAIVTTTNGAISGNDSFQGGGTAATNSGTATVTGTSTAFLSSFGLRAMTGTITSSAGTVTGTGTKFLSEIALGDLIGTSAKGFFQVTAIASDTSLTLVSTPGSAFSGQAPFCIENPTIKVSTNTAVQVTAIASDTSLTIAANSSATVSGATYRIGVPAATTTLPATNNMHMHVWVGSGSTGTGCYISTQRTLPFGITGYTTYIRRVGSLPFNAASLIPFDQFGNGSERTYQYEVADATLNTRVLSAGNATAWTQVACAGVLPPTASALVVNMIGLNSAGKNCYIRKRNTGDATTTRSIRMVITDAGNGNWIPSVVCAVDGAQYIDYVCDNALANLYLDVIGYKEYL